MKISILAIGKIRGAEADLCAEYQKRLGEDVRVRDFAAPKSLSSAEMQKAEAHMLLKSLPQKAFVVLLDERGKDMASREFAAKLSVWQESANDLAFIIGGADGVSEDVRKRADLTLSFGKQTWPHRLVRVMLLEQIYRAKQIIAGHPYHRD